MRNRHALPVAALLLATAVACLSGLTALAPAGAADPESLPGLATVSGTVQASKPFKAAQVHLMNTDKNVLFMVYTSGGRYRAPNLLPGSYEVSVRSQGLAGEPQKLQLAAGASQTLDFSLRETAAA